MYIINIYIIYTFHILEYTRSVFWNFQLKAGMKNIPTIQTIFLQVSWYTVKWFVLHNQKWMLNWAYKHLTELKTSVAEVCKWCSSTGYALWQFWSNSLRKIHLTGTILKFISKYVVTIMYNWILYVESYTKSVCLFLCFANADRLFPFDFVKQNVFK